MATATTPSTGSRLPSGPYPERRGRQSQPDSPPKGGKSVACAKNMEKQRYAYQKQFLSAQLLFHGTDLLQDSNIRKKSSTDGPQKASCSLVFGKLCGKCERPEKNTVRKNVLGTGEGGNFRCGPERRDKRGCRRCLWRWHRAVLEYGIAQLRWPLQQYINRGPWGRGAAASISSGKIDAARDMPALKFTAVRTSTSDARCFAPARAMPASVS